MRRFISFLLALTLCELFSFTAWAAAPKRPLEITAAADRAYVYFEAGNKSLTKGDLKQAGRDFEKAYAIAVSIDDASLLCRICLSAVSHKILLGNMEMEDNGGVFSGYSCSDLVSMARDFASRSENQLLTDVCSLYEASIILSANPVVAEDVQNLISSLKMKEKIFSREPYYLGFYYRTMGDLLKLLEKYQEAAKMYENAVSIHLKERYLYELGHDWYLCASVHSLAGNKKSALEAIEMALKYDRAAENTFAIASDYEAYGRILLKNLPSQEEKDSAVKALNWASAIYESGGYPARSDECRNAAAAVN